MNQQKKHISGILIAALSLTLVSLACGWNLNLPVTKIKTGAIQSVALLVPLPEDASTDISLNLEFTTGQLKLSPGVSGALVSGTATYNAPDFEPQVVTSGSSYTLRTGDLELKGIPKVEGDLRNEWDLQLADIPLSLTIQAGAYDGSFELGGLSLEKLFISEGGSNVSCSFSAPNLVEMSTFTFETGASSTVLRGLANANFTQMTFEAGAGEYTLSFDGTLQRDASVSIDSGLGTLTLIVPQGVNAHLTFDGGLSTIHQEGGWEQDGTTYTLSGSGPRLEINVQMGAGTLNLKTD